MDDLIEQTRNDCRLLAGDNAHNLAAWKCAAELEAARKLVGELQSSVLAHMRRAERAEAELAAVREDAERLDSGRIAITVRNDFLCENVLTVFQNIDLRAAIDAARAADMRRAFQAGFAEGSARVLCQGIKRDRLTGEPIK